LAWDGGGLTLDPPDARVIRDGSENASPGDLRHLRAGGGAGIGAARLKML
jgi:hypothetical protein